jgi:hypothetical protein
MQSSTLAPEPYLVFLRSTQSGLFYVNPGHWTADPSQARNLHTITNAVAARTAPELTGTEIVLYYQQVDCQVRLPVQQWW